MRVVSVLLVLSCVLFPSLTHAQVKLEKHTYNIDGLNIERGDFTGDGLPDILTYDFVNVQILRNSGGGQFDNVHIFTLA